MKGIRKNMSAPWKYELIYYILRRVLGLPTPEDTKHNCKNREDTGSMNLENWLYRRDREEYFLTLPYIDIFRHIRLHEEAEFEIERILRA